MVLAFGLSAAALPILLLSALCASVEAAAPEQLNGAGLLADAAREESGPLYTPPKKYSPRARIGGQYRGTEGPIPEVQAIVPDHVGFTVKPTPTLNWFISKPTPHRVIFTLTSMDSIRPLYEGPVAEAAKEGIHSIDLKSLGITLQPDVQYRWHVSVVLDPETHSKDLVAGGIIERCEFTDCTVLQPNLSCSQQSVVENMRNGFWYDAMGCLCSLIDNSPSEAGLRRLRAQLLKQVGLHGVAEWDLRAIGKASR